MKRLLIVPAAALTFVLGGCGKPAASADDAEGAKAPVTVEMADVTARDIRETVSLQGSFVPAQGTSAKLAPTAAGRVGKVLVREGDTVSAGELLALIDNRVQVAQGRSAALGAASAFASAKTANLTARAAKQDQLLSVETAQVALETARTEGASDIAQRDMDRKTAAADLSRLREGARPQEKAQAHQAVVQAQIAQRHAAQELKRSQALAQEGFISKRDLADAVAALDTADSNLETAKQAESLVLAGPRSQELAAAAAKLSAADEAYQSAVKLAGHKVALAEAGLRQAKQGLLTVQAREADSMASQAAASQKAADSAAAKAAQDLTEIRSPISGRVTHRYLNPGDLADTTVPILEVTGAGKVDFLGSLPASDAANLHAGMAATLGDASGVVTSVSAGDPTTGLATVRISTSAKAVAGTYGTALVIVEVHRKVLSVPSDAVFQREGKTILFVVDGGAAKQVEVDAGADDGGFTEIDKGVTAGQKVVKLGQSELSDGDKVKEAEAKAEPDGAKAGGG